MKQQFFNPLAAAINDYLSQSVIDNHIEGTYAETLLELARDELEDFTADYLTENSEVD